MTDTVKAKIIELVPEIRTHESRCMTCGYGFEYCQCVPINKEWYQDRPITLADVLRAIPVGVYMKSLGEQVRFVTYDDSGESHPGIEYWDLTASYDDQTPEVKAFIGNLLGV